MFKRLIVILMMLCTLCSCGHNKFVTCKLEKDNSYISLDIKAINDDISSIKVRTCFELPNSLFANSDWLAKLDAQLDDTYHYEDNNLVCEYEIALDDVYSLNKTVEYLRREKYYCE